MRYDISYMVEQIELGNVPLRDAVRWHLKYNIINPFIWLDTDTEYSIRVIKLANKGMWHKKIDWRGGRYSNRFEYTSILWLYKYFELQPFIKRNPEKDFLEGWECNNRSMPIVQKNDTMAKSSINSPFRWKKEELEQVMRWHLTANFEQALPFELIPACLKTIEEVKYGEGEARIILPKNITYRGGRWVLSEIFESAFALQNFYFTFKRVIRP